MKIEKAQPIFTPITVTLESQFEIDVLHELLGSVDGNGKVRKFCNEFYSSLQPYIETDGETYFDLGSTVSANNI